MLNSNTSYLEAYKAPYREIKGSIICNHNGANYEIGADTNLKSFKIEKTSPQGKFFGFAVSQKITIEILGIFNNVSKGDKLTVNVGLVSETSNVNLPYFYVDDISISKVDNKTVITGYDVIGSNRDKVISQISFTYPTTAKAYATKIATSIGATVDYLGYNFNIAESPNFDGSESIQDALTGLAETAGAICYVPYGNIIRFRVLGKTVNDVITPNEYYKLSTGESIELTEIASATELGDNIIHGTSGFTQILYENPFLNLRDDVASILNGMSSNVISLVNVPYQLEWRGCPAYEMGDYIKIVETDNTTKYIYYLNETLTYNGGLSASSSWESVESGNIEGTSSISQVIGKTQAKVDKVNREISLLVEEQAEINGELTTLRSELRQTASGFEQYVEDEVNGLRSEVNQTVSGINQTITNTKKDLQSEIDQTESSLSSRITSQGKTITEIRQDLDGINLSYNSTNGTASITIGDITVSNLVNGEYVDKQVAGIELDGYVKFNDLSTSGSTTINGSNITTGTISANRINMTGAIDWSDLSSGCRNTISGLVSDTDLPDYLQSTYIDATRILSPTIEGGSLTSTSKINNNTHSTVIEDSKIDFWIREGSSGSSSFGYKAGYIQAYANDTGTASSARTGLIIKAPWDGSSYSGGLTLSADRGLVIQSVNQDIFFYTPQYPNGLSLTALASGSGGGGSSTAVFG